MHTKSTAGVYDYSFVISRNFWGFPPCSVYDLPRIPGPIYKLGLGQDSGVRPLYFLTRGKKMLGLKVKKDRVTAAAGA